MPGVPNFRVDDPAKAEKIAVGDYVRSYDWEHRDDCYYEGIVDSDTFEWEGCPRYLISVAKHVVEGREIPTVAEEMKCFPPVNGVRVLLGGYCNGVRKVQP